MNGLYRRTVAAIRAIDPDHIIFLEGEGYSERFEGLEPPFAGNLVYSLHHYTKAGFGPGPYRGSVEQVRRNFRATEGARFAERHGVPLWVGEFGAVYNGPAGEIDDRLQALDDQIEMLESEGVHWTLWTYKDCGVLGWVTLDPESPYMRITRELRAAKLALDTDFWLHWLPAPPFRRERNALARSILELSGSDVSPEAHETHVGLALSTYAGALLQPVFAALFRGVSDQELDKALASFSLEQCRPNTRLLERIRRFMKPE